MEDQRSSDDIEVPARISQKQRVLEARGHDVPLDYFLYSCLERERLEKAKIGTGDTTITYPELGSASSSGTASFNDTFKALLAWYRSQFADLSDERALDHEQLAKVVAPVVGLNRDLDLLHQAKHGAKVPEFVRKGEPAPIWADIERLVRDAFPKHAHLYVRYLQWAHGREEEEAFEPGSRPPVGRYAPPPLPRTSSSGGFGGRSGPGGRPSSGPGGRPSSRGPSSDRPERPSSSSGNSSRPSSSDRAPGPRRAAGDRPPPRGPRPEGRSSFESDKPRSPRPPRAPRGENDEQTARQTATSLAEVDQALATLQQDGQLEGLTLKPTNSFYRRLQHQKIVDAGYESNSVGEGPERAVKISRKGP